jgi:uncharacterized paraquat-inducible protein A
MIIIELDDYDAYRVLWLVELWAKALNNPNRQQYWAELENKIKQCMDAQASGKFFQCSACTDEEHQAMLQADRCTNYGRNDPAA